MKSFETKDMDENHNNTDVVPNAQKRNLGDYSRAVVTENYTRIRSYPIDVDNFKIMSSLISMLQLH